MKKGGSPFDLLEDRSPTEVDLDIDPKTADSSPAAAVEVEDEDKPEADNAGVGTTEEGGKETEGEDANDYTVSVDGNPIYLLAKKWQAEGKYPEGELKEDLTEEDFDKTLYAYKEALIYNDLKQKALEELAEVEGLNPSTIKAAKMLHYGVADTDLRALEVFTALSNLKLDPESETYDNDVRELGMAYYIRRNFTPEQAERHVNRDMAEEDLGAVVKEYQQFFKSAAAELEEHIQAKAEREKQARLERYREEVNQINTLLDKGVIAGTTYSKAQIEKVRRAIFDRTEVVEAADGTKRYVTLEQKIAMDVKSDPEKRLKARIDFILGPVTSDESDAALKASISLASGLKKMVKVKPKDTGSAVTQRVDKRKSDAVEYETELIY